MGITTNLGQSPYWNDYTANSQYYHTLFKPSTPVQTRELNATQSMLLNQINSFGDNIFVGGTIIKGCNITKDNTTCFVKLVDTYTDGRALTVSDLIETTVISETSGLAAYVKAATQGYVATSPNLNTIFIKYLNSGTTTNVKTFQQNETLSFYNKANVLIGKVIVATDSTTTGFSYILGVDEGIIYQNGMFLNVAKQSIIVTPYNNLPDGISVGFSSPETIITAFQDPNLNDNSMGSPNYQGPGADRLKIIPTLSIANTSAVYSNNFFSIIDFVGGQPSYVNQDTQYSVIGDKMAQISDDTNGSFVIKNFTVGTGVATTSDGLSIDTNNIKVSVGTGLGYINGKRINMIGSTFTNIPKGNTVGQATSELFTTQMGNYVTVKEVAGYFDPSTPQTVSLYSANTAAISNYISKGNPVTVAGGTGSVIGTASLIGMEYVSGNFNTSNGTFNMYLTNIQMVGTNQFSSVCSIYSSIGSNVKGYADIIQPTGSTYSVLQSPNTTPLIYPLGSDAVWTLKNSLNATDTQFQYVVGSAVNFSSANSVLVPISTHIGGNDILPMSGSPIATALEPQFRIVCETSATTANIAGHVANTANSTTLNGVGTSFTTTLYPGALIYISNGVTTEYKQVNNIINDTTLVLNQSLTNAWTGAGANVAIQYQAGTLLPVSSSPITINVVSPTSFTANLNTNLATGSTFTANIIYNVQRTNALPRKKTLQTDVWVKIDCNTNPGGTTGPWCLGFPDVFQIQKVYICSGNYNTGTVLTNNWSLKNGQNDTYYGLSYLYNNGMSLTTSNQLFIQLKCFTQDSSTGLAFFSVDSYPVDDSGASGIYTRDIPIYSSAASSTSYNLRNCIDFRFYTSNTIPIVGSGAANASTLILNPANTVSFISTNMYIPAVDTPFQTSFKYYMGRYDTVGLSTSGQIQKVLGTPSVTPQPSGLIPGGMTLAYVYVPPYPSVTPDIIDTNMANTYPTTSISYHMNKRYTMADIGALEKRISQVEYYTSLSLLEQSTQNLILTNTNGQTRFQNGILADPMDNFAIANTSDISFNIAIDSTASVARPTFNQYLNNLKYNASTSVNTTLSNNGKIVSLNYNSEPYFSQQFASQQRNCAQDVTYVWNGTVIITPDGDYYPDVTVDPSVIANQDMYSNFVNLINAWNTQYATWTETGSSTTTSTSSSQSVLTNPFFHGFALNTASTTTQATTTNYQKTLLAVSESTSTTDLGSYLTSVSILPFCRPNLLKFNAYGLKPNTQVWVFVNRILMTKGDSSTYTAQTDSSGVLTSPYTLTTDQNGNIYGLLWIPPQTFHTGTLTVEILDIQNVNTQSNIITSQGSCFYYGTNISYTQNDITLQTESPQFSTYTLSNNVTTTITTSSSSNMYFDPIGQTFSILQSALPSTVQGVYLTGLDLFFANKDTNLGISLHIEPLENGYPTGEIVQNSIVHLNSSQVLTSQNASVATNFAFNAPVFLECGNYAFIVIPDGSNPNYDIWTGVIGGKDVLYQSPIYNLSSSGAMLMSSQAITWTPYQNEAIKYNFYHANFSTSSGVASFTNDNSEFCNINNVYKSMLLGDKLYFGNVSGKLTGNTLISSNIVKVTSTASLLAGSTVAIASNSNGNSIVTTISSIVNSTAFTVPNILPGFWPFIF